MSGTDAQAPGLSPEKQALLALRRLKQKLDALERARREPIAIVGIGCRFPGGASDPDAFWRLLRDGVDAIREVPPDRWDIDAVYDAQRGTPGKSYSRWGGFLDRIDTFDAKFFGISPREAVRVDPQQRLFLEVVWEALENAGIAPTSLAGSRTGVFVGTTVTEYMQLHTRTVDPTEIDAYVVPGNTIHATAGRVSYFLGLHGPSMAIDSACSSSLVAIDRACRSLRDGECDLVIAGGVNLMVVPETFICFSQWGMLAADGRCKTFDARADGFVRGEGCGVVVLKRLSDAQAAGDRILAVIRGTAVNQDGPSSGLSVPNGLAQQAVIREALANAGVEPGDVGYVEAHGTGTSLGDPIEVEALDAVLGRGRDRERPLLIGSVKTNIGHLEAASGVAGLIKTVLALRHGEIPPSLHFREPNPLIAWERMRVRVAAERTVWERGESGSRIAGVSSFGFSGTNAHVVVEEWRGGEEAERAESGAERPVAVAVSGAGGSVRLERTGHEQPAEEHVSGATRPVALQASGVERPVEVLTLSARDEAALGELASRYAQYLDAHAEQRFQDVAHTANVGRAHLPHRAALVARTAEEARSGLLALATGGEAVGLRRGVVERRPEVVFLFTGQGSQYAGMGRELYESSPVFRSALERCAAVLESELEVPLLEVLYPERGGRGEGLLERTEYTQPALFALEWSLAELWRSWGVEPALVLGHSVGEYVAACVAGVLEVEEALRLVAVRGRLMGSLPAGGVMVAVFAAEARVREVVERVGGGEVSVAAVNAPESVVVSGAGEAVERVVGELVRGGVGVQRLRVSHAFHSALMEPVVGEFERVASGVRYGEARIGVVSNVTGEVVGSEVLGRAGYWARQLREAVRYADGVKALWARGQRVFVEVGPGATLVGLGRQCVPEAERGVWLSSLRPGRGEWETLLGSVAELYVRGVEVDWAGVDRPYRRRRVELPTYPFQRQRYWIEPRGMRPAARRAAHASGAAAAHPLLGERLSTAGGERIFEARLSLADVPWLADHRVHGQAVLPGTAYLEMALAAGSAVLDGGADVLEDVVLHAPLRLPDEGEQIVQVVVTPTDGGAGAFRIASLEPADAEAEGRWLLHASGVVRRAGAAAAPAADADLDALAAACAEEISVQQVYDSLVSRGVEHHGPFRGLATLRRGGDEAFAHAALPAASAAPFGDYRLSPPLLDSCFQALVPLFPAADTATYVPMGVERLRQHRPMPDDVRCRATLRSGGSTPGTLRGDVVVHDAAGRLVLEVEGLALRAIERGGAAGHEGFTYEVTWIEAQRGEAGAEAAAPGAWLILADSGGVGEALAARLRAGGDRCVVAVPRARGAAGATGIEGNGRAPAGAPEGVHRVDAGRPEDFARLVAAAFPADGPPARGVVHLWSLDDAPAPADLTAEVCAELSAAQLRMTGSALHLTRALVEAGQAPRLWLVTRGAQPASPGERVEPHAAALWGLGRTIMTEHPEFRCALVDLDPAAQDGADALLPELRAPDGEDQIAIRGGTRLVARLVRWGGASRSSDAAASPPQEGPFELCPSGTGVLDDVQIRPMERRPPGPREVEIEVVAAGLNFRDVLNALGEYPGGPVPFGAECAGIVTAVGAEVHEVAVGDAVIALAPGSFRSFVVTRVECVVKKPAALTFVDAAALPSAFVTAWYALHTLARIGPGRRVLIHAAAGGVGMAAVRLAQRAGAEVFATAGSPAKRALLEAMGVRHVMDSRTLGFAGEIARITGGRGVDVVLNSLAGEFIPASLEALAEDGCFIEMGKRDVWDAARVAEVRPRATYHVIDVGVVIAEQPATIGEMLRGIVAAIEAGELAPLPTRAFPMQAAAEALRFMAQARHTGKIVLTHPPRRPADGLRADGTYLVTGGLGGLGLRVAKWLVERGARHLALVGRSAPSEEAAAALRELEAGGARVAVLRADVSRLDDVDRVLSTIGRTMPALRGVVHAAGVLDEGTLRQQEWSRFARVFAPKVDGGWILHARTQGLPLDFFVLFSSGAALIGAGGLANHAAACSFLDALAHHRRAAGLPALSINWGRWSDVGVAAADRVGERLAARGIGAMTSEQALSALDAVLARADACAQVAVLPVDWTKLLASRASPQPLFSLVAAAARTAAAQPQPDAAPDALAHRLREAAPARRRAILLAHVREQAARALGIAAPQSLDPGQPLRELGLDSLIAVELRNLLGVGLELPRTLPATLAFDYPTVEALTIYLERELFPEQPTASVADLSDEEAEALLLAELDALRPQGE